MGPIYTLVLLQSTYRKLNSYKYIINTPWDNKLAFEWIIKYYYMCQSDLFVHLRLYVSASQEPRSGTSPLRPETPSLGCSSSFHVQTTPTRWQQRHLISNVVSITIIWGPGTINDGCWDILTSKLCSSWTSSWGGMLYNNDWSLSVLLNTQVGAWLGFSIMTQCLPGKNASHCVPRHGNVSSNTIPPCIPHCHHWAIIHRMDSSQAGSACTPRHHPCEGDRSHWMDLKMMRQSHLSPFYVSGNL